MPVRSQSQESLTDQIYELIDLANQNGLYDAADWVKKRFDEPLATSFPHFFKEALPHGD